jgi:hypothetical protein
LLPLALDRRMRLGDELTNTPQEVVSTPRLIAQVAVR